MTTTPSGACRHCGGGPLDLLGGLPTLHWRRCRQCGKRCFVRVSDGSVRAPERDSNDSAESLLAEILQQNLQVSPELQAKRRRLLEILIAEQSASKPLLRILRDEPRDDSEPRQPAQ